MSFRLLVSFLFSLALHAGVLLYHAPPADAPRPRRLTASLLPPAGGARPAPTADQARWLKNTLASANEKSAASKRVLAPGSARPASDARQDKKREVAAAQRKLSQHVYYPPEAVARGIEGEVRLLLILGDDGRILEVHVAARSGHPLLDEAAVRAARAMGRVSWTPSRELILPVVFRLE